MEEEDAVAGIVKRTGSELKTLGDTVSELRDLPDALASHTQVKEILLDLEISHDRLHDWTKKWRVESRPSGSVYLKVWGCSGLDAVQDRLLAISNQINQTRQLAEQHRKHSEGNKQENIESGKVGQRRRIRRIPWKKALQLRSQGPSPKITDTSGLTQDVTTLKCLIDELYTVSSMAFDSTRSVPRPARAGDDNLAVVSQKGMAGGMALLPLCNKFNEDVFLDMNLLGRTQSITDPHVKFRLFNREHPIKLADREFVRHDLTGGRCRDCNTPVENTQKDLSVLWKMRPSSESTFLRLPSSEGHDPCFEVSAPGSSSPSRVPLARYLKSSEADELERSEPRPYLSRIARISLALQLLQSGFFLLYTPWFSNLNDKTLLVLDNKQYALQKKPVDLQADADMRPGVSIRTSNLFRLGVLLVEIAVGKSLDDSSDRLDSEPIKQLPLVARTMGLQYRDAAAFCLKRGRVRELGARESPDEARLFLTEYYNETISK